MREDSFVSSNGPDQYSETAIFSDSETQDHATPSQEFEDQLTNSPSPDSEAPPTSIEVPSSDENQMMKGNKAVSDHLLLDADLLSSLTPNEPVEAVEEIHVPGAQHGSEKKEELSEKSTSEPCVLPAHRSTSIVCRADSLSVSSHESHTALE